MINWFIQQSPTVQAAIIAGLASILVAIITGIFKLIEYRKKGQKSASNINIMQSTTGNNNRFIGIQNSGEKRND